MADNPQLEELIKSWMPKMKGGLITFLNFYKSLADMAIDNLKKLEDPVETTKKRADLHEVKKDKKEE